MGSPAFLVDMGCKVVIFYAFAHFELVLINYFKSGLLFEDAVFPTANVLALSSTFFFAFSFSALYVRKNKG